MVLHRGTPTPFILEQDCRHFRASFARAGGEDPSSPTLSPEAPTTHGSPGDLPATRGRGGPPGPSRTRGGSKELRDRPCALLWDCLTRRVVAWSAKTYAEVSEWWIMTLPNGRALHPPPPGLIENPVADAEERNKEKSHILVQKRLGPLYDTDACIRFPTYLLGSLPLLGFARDASLAQYMQMKRKCIEEQRGLRLQKLGNLGSWRQHHWKVEKDRERRTGPRKKEAVLLDVHVSQAVPW
ncbi:hypothetical protein B0T18DRAFT_491375 [Schizothecium vesticola]|uniref:Uncharacterized protein n=1 Tax=Schizothecium vesticola TaxID=314040 RepID=A0AA40JZW5_9PEZI|nr:hypothetical protein B0T18DRAFT_491375 [Schizothecium vesticola]